MRNPQRWLEYGRLAALPLQYSLFRPILPSLHRPLGALGSNPLSGQA